VGSVFIVSYVFQYLLLGQLIPQWGMAALQSTSCPALELPYLCASLLGACVFAFPPFPGAMARSVIHQPAANYQHVVMVHCLFLHAAEPSDYGCPGTGPWSLLSSLLPYFRQWPITCPLSALLPFLYWWFTQVWLLAPPLFSGALSAALAPSAVC
jgi:hypothetical protein